MKHEDYVYGTAYVRALENKLLSKSDIEGLIAARDFKAAVGILRDKGYGEEITPQSLDKVLNQRLEESRREVLWASPNEEVLSLFLLKNDFHNLKAVLKVISSKGKDFERYIMTPAVTDFNNIAEAASKLDFSSLPEYMAETAKKAFDILNRTGDGALAEALIDKACMDNVLERAKKTGSKFLIGLAELENTMTDIKIAQRCARAARDKNFLEAALSEKSHIDRDGLISAAISNSVCEFLEEKGKKEEARTLKNGLGEFERFTRKKTAEYVKSAEQITFGAEPIVAYLLKKQAEIQTIRIILNAKNNNIEEQEIRKRVG